MRMQAGTIDTSNSRAATRARGRVAARLFSMRQCYVVLLILALTAIAADDPPAIRVATVTFGKDQPTECFSDGFLTLVDRDSHLTVQRTLDNVDLASDQLFDHPMVVMAGNMPFTLSDKQVDNLTTFLKRGGFLLASASCSNAEFDASFRQQMQRVLPGAKLAALPTDHAMMSMLYQVDRVITVKPSEKPLLAVTIDGRVAVLYSPIGLNDSMNMGAECCCCGANEIRNARQINANALVYAVTR